MSNTMSLLLTAVLICTISITEAQYPSSCSHSEYGDVRLYNTYTSTDDDEDGALQLCYYGTWYSVCDSNWDCSDGNVACYQLGYDKARQVVHNSDNYFGYWSHIRNYYYSCSGNEHSLGSCSSHYTYSCSPSSDAAGVRCVKASDSSCSSNGALRLVGGQTSHEGVLEYCYYGKWSPFCYLDDEEASIACKQMGYSKYAAFLSPDEYLWDIDINTTYTGSLFNHFSCSTHGTENSLSSCTFYSTSSSSCAVSCTQPRAIRCYETENDCIDGQARLVNGSIAQTGRVEVCVDGVWGSVCDVGWTKSDAFVVCKQLGYVNSEPFIYTDSKYGKGDGPIVYSNVNCHGWEKTLTECTKTNYLHFTCSDTAGVLCPDDCVEGEVRLVGGETNSEGTIEVCLNSVWGLITDAGWDQNDGHVVCRQLNLPIDGAIPVLNSYYGKPDRAIHYSYILCNGNEQLITSCNKIIHSLEEGRQIYNEAEVAGVACNPASPTPEPTEEVCLPKPVGTGDMCVSGNIQLDDENGMLEYCINGRWSVFCQLTHSEATVACRQLGHVTYTRGLPFEIKESSSSTADKSLFKMITCTSSEKSLSDCNIQEGDCMKYCSTIMGLRCFVPEDCTEGSVQLIDGIEQGGRVEVCVNGVWGSVCGEGWDKTDAYVVCKQMGFPDLEPTAYSGDEFGVSTGPVVYSDVDCSGWENYLIECQKKNYLETTCSYATVAGVMCADDCGDGDVRLVGGETISEGTVEICFDSLWGLIDEAGWGIADAVVICHELGFHDNTADALLHSYYGKPNKAIHIGDVECYGTEDKLTECAMKSYSLKDGNNLQDKVDVAGVSCVLSSSNNLTSSILPPGSSPSDQHHQSGLSLTAILSVVSIILVCLFFIVILFLCIGFVIYCKRKYIKKVRLRRRLPIAMSNIFGEEYSSLHSSDEEISEKKEKDEELHTTGDNPDNSYQDDPTFKDDDSEHIYEYAQSQS